MPREHVQFFEVDVGESQHLGEEGIEPYVVVELPAELNPRRLW